MLKILIYTPYFYPSMGGLEVVTDTLASTFSAKGLEVEVYTPFSLGNNKELKRNYKITRSTSNKILTNSVKNCDIFVHNSVSLRAILPLLFYRKKWFVVHHMILANDGLRNKLISFLKRFISKFANNIAVSKFMADYYGNKSKVIPNPVTLNMKENIFKIKKTKDFVFFGRLIKDKGAHIAIEALKSFDDKSTLTIIGTGLEENNLRNLVEKLNLRDRVSFKGRLNGSNLFDEIEKHKVALIPSICTEAFGVVVLEAYACGCKVVASDIGGLPDAVGDCGILVKPNNINSLKAGMKQALLEKSNVELIKEHLNKHSGPIIAERFINEFKKGN